MNRTLLVVDDIRGNREILKGILREKYDILEAADGQEALAALRREGERVSAVLLDLIMPVMDGFELLGRIRADKALAQIPVIVTTVQTDAESEARALQLGANDYITKPYNATVIRRRVWNAINLRETSATVDALRRDQLTGLYNRETFLEIAEGMIAARAPGYYIMSSFDVNGFKLVNEQYGTAEGDNLLRRLGGNILKGMARIDGIGCRLSADNFAALYPAAHMSEGPAKKIREGLDDDGATRFSPTFCVGRCVVSDKSLSAAALYDRAYIAKQSVKGRYDVNLAFFDDSMLERLLHSQRVTSQMSAALRGGQFEAWFQPQYNHETGALIGAEALARWRHPEKGLIPPGEFIPLFERNGFIYELDKYIWEQVCALLRRWLDEGRNPLPVSVNVSRYDILHFDLVDTIDGLLKKYALPAALLRLEITESAFEKSTEQIIAVVQRLIDDGFTVEIDDFGSGYSSLNTLKDVPAQIVKLDMRFLESRTNSQRGGNIIESVVRMTKWLGMSVIAEGVETVRQADFLKSIGCSYVQGYLYAKPMTVKAYEALCGEAKKEEQLIALETVENLDNNAFWDPGSMDTLIFNSYVGAACIFEYHLGRIELLRATDKYAQMFGAAGATIEGTLKINWADHMRERDLTDLAQRLRQSVETKAEVTGEYVFDDLPGCAQAIYLRATMRVIATAGERWLVYCTNDNITAQRQAERQERRVAKQLQGILDNVNCGITAVKIDGERAAYVLANDRYYDMLGYTRAQFQQEIGEHAFSTIYPADRARVLGIVRRVSATGKPAKMEYRATRRDGRVIYLRSALSVATFEGDTERTHLCTYVDITAQRHMERDILDNLPGGAGLFEFDGRALSVVHLNKRYWELVGRDAVDGTGHSVLDAVHPNDHALLLGELARAIEHGTDAECDLRVLNGEGGYSPFHIVGRIVPQAGGKYAIYAWYTPMTDEAMTIRGMLPIVLAAMMAASADLSFVKDKNLRYICCSRAFAKMAGLKSETEVAGKTDYDLFEPALADKYTADDRTLMESGRSINGMTERLPALDGRGRYALTSKYPLCDSLGRVVGLYGTGRDVTEMRENESRLRLLTDSMPGGLASYEYRGERLSLVYFNDGFLRLFNVTREAYEAASGGDALYGVFQEDLPALQKQLRALRDEDTPVDCICRTREGLGGVKWINVKAVPMERAGGTLHLNAVLFDVTRRQNALNELRISEEESRLALCHSRMTVCRFDARARTLTLGKGVAAAYEIGEKLDDLPFAPIREGRISPETAGAYQAFYEKILRGEKEGEVVYQRLSRQGWRWLEAHFSAILTEDSKPLSAVISFIDVTDAQEKEAVYQKWLQSMKDKEPGSYTLCRCNVTRQAVYDATQGSLLGVRFTPEALCINAQTEAYAARFVLKEDRARFVAFLNTDSLLARFYHGRRSVALEYREKRPGDCRWIRVTVDMVQSARSTDVEAYLLFENVDQAKRAELKTIERAETDPLTGALNRAAFSERMGTLLESAAAGENHALLMLDIDGFKHVNDALGHAAGDQALVDITGALSGIKRQGDLLCRFGGDEFMLLMKDVPGDAVAARKAQQIGDLLRRTYGDRVKISCSIGIAMFPRDGADFETLYHRADAALYQVKKSGRDHFAFYFDTQCVPTGQEDGEMP